MQLFEDIKIITLFSLTFYAIFLFNYKKGHRLSNLMLGWIYAFQGMEMLNGTFYRFADFWINQFPWVFYLTEFTFFLWGPAIYFFFRTSIDKDYTFHKKDLLHLAPAIVHTLFLTFHFHINPNDVKTIMLKSGVMSAEQDFIIHLTKNLSAIVYIFFSARLFLNAEPESTEKRKWMIFFLVVFSIVELILILQFVDIETRIYNTIIYNTTSIIWFLVAIMTLYKALKNPFFFANEKPVEIKIKETDNKDKLSIEDDEHKDILLAIQKCISEEEIFLNPDLNLQVLSKKIGFSSKKVSFVVNDSFDKNISDFINSHRIDKAKTLLVCPDHKEKTIIEIAYEVGFNSKATFNRAFTKFVEISPTEFRNSQE